MLIVPEPEGVLGRGSISREWKEESVEVVALYTGCSWSSYVDLGAEYSAHGFHALTLRVQSTDISISGIIILVWGTYLVYGYLVPEGQRCCN